MQLLRCKCTLRCCWILMVFCLVYSGCWEPVRTSHHQ